MRGGRPTANQKLTWWESFRRDHIRRSAALALLTYAFGLIPFYFLTPIHDSVQDRVVSSSPTTVVTPTVAPPTSTSTPRVDPKARVGADSSSVIAPTVEVVRISASVPVEIASDPRYAVLLLGYGGAGHDGAYLSDSMMVVIVDPDRKTLGLVSLPRDTWVPLLFGSGSIVYNKVNTAYAFARDSSLFADRLGRYTGDKGGGIFASDTVARILGVPIRYYVGLDFSGFRQMIDAVGGIDVDVPAPFAARYPANDDPSVDASWTVVRFVKGNQHLGGERSIEFARAREIINNADEGTDFARSRRQRLIIEAFKRRLFQPGGLIQLPRLLGIATGHVDTNYSAPDAAALSRLALDWKDVTIYQSALAACRRESFGTGYSARWSAVLTEMAADSGGVSVTEVSVGARCGRVGPDTPENAAP